MSSTSILDAIGHYQRSIENSQNNESRLLHCIAKLFRMPVTVEHLQETGVGKTVNSLRKFNGEVGKASKSLVTKWKTMVAAEEDSIELKTSTHENIPMYNNKIDKKYSSNNDKNNEQQSFNNIKKIETPILSYNNEKYNNSHQNESNNSHHSKHSHNGSNDRFKGKINLNNEKRSDNQSDYSSSNKKGLVEDDEDDKLVIDVNGSSKIEETDNIKKADSSKVTKEEKSLSDKKDKSESSSHERRHHASENVNNHRSPGNERREHKHKVKKHKTDSKDDSIKHTISVKHEHKKHKSDKERKKESESVTSKEKHENSQKNESSKNNEKVRHKEREHHRKSRNNDHEKSKHSHTYVETKLDKEKRKYSDSDSNSSLTKKQKTSKSVDESELDGSMGASFEDALGMCNYPSTSKTSKKLLKSSQSLSTSNEKDTSSADKGPALLSSNIKLEPLDPTIALSLPSISTNYRPMPLNQTVMDCVFSNNNKPKRTLTDEEALSHGISSKTMRTKVYSGVKTGALLQVPSLFDICIRILQKNIDALEYTGGIPFELLRPVLERASPQQLLNFEEFNPYLLEDSDVLWELHVNRHYRTQKREEFESWREMFWRCKENQDNRLNLLAENIKLSQQQTSLPVRKTQLAYVDSMVKPPRNVQRKQDQFGTKQKPIATPASRVAALSIMTPNAAKVGDTRLRVAANARDNAQVTAIRPKKAPLMQKALQTLKGRFKR